MTVLGKYIVDKSVETIRRTRHDQMLQTKVLFHRRWLAPSGMFHSLRHPEVFLQQQLVRQVDHGTTCA
jgi:hypothetical protein